MKSFIVVVFCFVIDSAIAMLCINYLLSDFLTVSYFQALAIVLLFNVVIPTRSNTK